MPEGGDKFKMRFRFSYRKWHGNFSLAWYIVHTVIRYIMEVKLSLSELTYCVTSLLSGSGDRIKCVIWTHHDFVLVHILIISGLNLPPQSPLNKR